ncbi:ABC transporter ATP-binding protein, partial [Candidatus Dojkabacteria bacterium]|nr:ABC transporter ATP-binding protein [Candidatus Dojkabacteria bacterium]
RNEKKASIYDGFSGAISTLGAISFWIFTIYKVLQGDITIGALTFYIGMAGSYTSSLEGLMRELSRFYRDSSFMTSYYKFLEIPNKIISGKKKLSSNSRPPEIVFKHVDFIYPNSQKIVIEDLELTINPGERIALVGTNGSGKSTIIKLLCRLYDVSSGTITIDGIDIKELDVTHWHQQIGVLFQNFNKYGVLNAGENISIGNTQHAHQRDLVLEASKKAEAHEFLQKLDKGYNQVLSKRFKRGTNLSGGEWQKVALARNFYRDAPILILDEPTSAIDAISEEKIFERLYKFAANKTVIIVSHRFSTVRKADKIYVLDAGKIIEGGTHEELMKLNGKYAEAFAVQAKGYK